MTGGALHQEHEVVEVDRFLEKIKGAFLHGPDGFFDGAEGGEKDYRNSGVGVLGLAQDVETGSSWHFQVSDDEQIPARAHLLDGGGSVRRLIYGVTGALQRFAEHGAQFIFVFDKKERFHLLRFYHVLRGEPEERLGDVRRECRAGAAVGGC